MVPNKDSNNGIVTSKVIRSGIYNSCTKTANDHILTGSEYTLKSYKWRYNQVLAEALQRYGGDANRLTPVKSVNE